MFSSWPGRCASNISEAFAAKIRPLVEERGELAEVPRIQRLVHRPELGSLFPKTVRLSKAARDEAIRQAYTEYGYTMAAIAAAAGIHYSTVSKIIRGER